MKIEILFLDFLENVLYAIPEADAFGAIPLIAPEKIAKISEVASKAAGAMSEESPTSQKSLPGIFFTSLSLRIDISRAHFIHWFCGVQEKQCSGI